MGASHALDTFEIPEVGVITNIKTPHRFTKSLKLQPRNGNTKGETRLTIASILNISSLI